jgi:adenine-specific DNA-methyltransferase
MGVGSTAIAALIHNRKAIGAEIIPEYVAIAKERIHQAERGQLRIRPMTRPIYDPDSPDISIPPQVVNLKSQPHQQSLLEKKANYKTEEER